MKFSSGQIVSLSPVNTCFLSTLNRLRLPILSPFSFEECYVNRMSSRIPIKSTKLERSCIIVKR